MDTKKIVINVIWSVLCFALAVAVFIVMLKGIGLHIVPKSSGDWFSGCPKDYSCMTIAFGETKRVLENAFDASPWLCLELFLLIPGAFLIPFTAFDSLVKRKVRVVLGVIATLFFVGAGVLFFLNGRLFVLGDYFYKKKVLENVLLGKITFKLGWGAITAGILSFVAAAFTAVKTALTFFKVL